MGVAAEDIPKRVHERILTRWVEGDGGCHLSTYTPMSNGWVLMGWAVAPYKGVTALHHRLMWQVTRGEIPEGYTIHHTCFTRNCVNIEHLQVMSVAENSARSNGEDWELGFCKHGHPRSETHTTPSGQRYCYPCKQVRWKAEYRARKRAERQQKEVQDSQRKQVPDPEHRLGPASAEGS